MYTMQKKKKKIKHMIPSKFKVYKIQRMNQDNDRNQKQYG